MVSALILHNKTHISFQTGAVLRICNISTCSVTSSPWRVMRLSASCTTSAAVASSSVHDMHDLTNAGRLPSLTQMHHSWAIADVLGKFDPHTRTFITCTMIFNSETATYPYTHCTSARLKRTLLFAVSARSMQLGRLVAPPGDMLPEWALSCPASSHLA